MRWLRYHGANGVRYAILEGETVAEIDTAPFEAWQRTGATAQLAAVKTLVPVVPGTFYAIGLNYAAHATQFAALQGLKIPTRPQPGYRANSALVAHGEAIVIPAESDGIQYEGELVAVIGKTARYVARKTLRDVKADGSVDRDRRRPAEPRDARADQRRAAARISHQRDDFQ